MKQIGAYRQRGKVAPQEIFKVTKTDIEKGCAKDSKLCAIAHAVLRKHPEAIYVRVDMREVSFSLPGSQIRRRYFQSAEGAKTTFHFDRGELDKLHPFTLRLNDGIEVPMGWRAKHPGSTREGKVYRRTGKRAVVRFTNRRYFGACNIKQDDAEISLLAANPTEAKA